jgi:hypothetical protein
VSCEGKSGERCASRTQLTFVNPCSVLRVYSRPKAKFTSDRSLTIRDDARCTTRSPALDTDAPSRSSGATICQAASDGRYPATPVTARRGASAIELGRGEPRTRLTVSSAGQTAGSAMSHCNSI